MTTRGRRRLSRKEEQEPDLPAVDGAVRPARREETMPVALAAVVVGFVALIVCVSRNYLLLYGDAVAHLGIARRILDTRNPGLIQLGGVWLPLSHLLMLPFVQRLDWWQNGLAGAWPSLLCFVLSVAGFYRLARRLVPPMWALVATAFYGLNPNLLYLSTTAMTEPLFLAIIIWTTLLTMECVAEIRASRVAAVNRKLVFLGLLIMAAVFTRYDGWIFGAAVWCVVAWQLYRSPIRPRVMSGFAVFTVLAVAGPAMWLGYNQHFFHDPLDFMRGPYSAMAIEKRTTPPGASHYPGWHNPVWAAVLYMRTSQVDIAAWETGFLIAALAIAGAVFAVRKRLELSSLLLWVPLPFYIYSIAFGAVPIFIPQLRPHSYYNSRYGMEMLPAFALFAVVALVWLQKRLLEQRPLVARLMHPIALLLVTVNVVVMMYKVPLVLKEAQVNSSTRIAFESAVAHELQTFPAGATILMYNSDHVGALQQAGIPLKQTLSETDYDSWKAALAAPAEHAAYVVAMDGDPVAAAVKAHPDGLTELVVLCSTGQPCARAYKSERFGG
ncbi:MAG: glycosyltransferase family 39 protein [Edaphobacter sp.]|uniref:ArnT family glycosyltransferase n=1 Tax=Edaphobacter sp. TaxID=1934404 RepID=UPI002395FAF8|nr:glycosyltransferase family 39 protein [Edaphobacter sp.]MDE1177823.1 glycosyltransferase family 39 protein [Edaphobacter sp.]